MLDYKLRKDEMETVLIFNLSDGYWEASTFVPEHMRKFEKAGWELTDDLGYEKGYRAPKRCVSFLNPARKTRTYTEEEKAARREQLAQARAQRR